MYKNKTNAQKASKTLTLKDLHRMALRAASRSQTTAYVQSDVDYVPRDPRRYGVRDSDRTNQSARLVTPSAPPMSEVLNQHSTMLTPSAPPFLIAETANNLPIAEPLRFFPAARALNCYAVEGIPASEEIIPVATAVTGADAHTDVVALRYNP